MGRFWQQARLILVLVVATIGLTTLPAMVDAASLYKLPYPAGFSAIVTQAPGTGGHVGTQQYAVDFAMPVGSTVVAARGGTVKYVKENSNVCGCSSAYGNAGNYVVVDHGDGTQALYLHLQYNGALVNVGERVAQGQPIAKSGMTGWTCGSAPGGCGPHLHFQVERSGSWFTQSVYVSFADILTNGGVPLSGRSYTSGNTFDGPPPPPANSCSGTDCNGKDPAELSCGADATTVATQEVVFTGVGSVRMELRWSNSCKTNWARAQVLSGSGMTMTVYLEDANGQQLAGTAAQGAAANLYGNMWYAPTQQVRACVTVAGAVKGAVCTKPV